MGVDEVGKDEMGSRQSGMTACLIHVLHAVAYRFKLAFKPYEKAETFK